MTKRKIPKPRKGLHPLVRKVTPHRNRKREMKKHGPEIISFPLRYTKPEPQEDT